MQARFPDFRVVDKESFPAWKLSEALIKSQKCEITKPALIACGHLLADVNLTPLLCLRHRNDIEAAELQLFVEIFGFLNVSDISHPPISSRHTLVAPSSLPSSKASQTENLLYMVLAALNSTTTVAMVNVYLQPPTKKPVVLKVTEETPQPFELPDSRTLLTHGYISRFSSKKDCLMLSLFPEGRPLSDSSWLCLF